MKPERALKHFISALLLAVLIYVVFYIGIEHLRNRKGPWSITFTNTIAGSPVVLINQPKIGITNVKLTFPDAPLPSTNSSPTWVFEQPRPVPFDVPFGQCLFMDTTFLPGTLTFRFFEHEVELLPRVMIIDHEEHPWSPGEEIALPVAHTNPPTSSSKPR